MPKVFSIFVICLIASGCSDYNKRQAEKKATIIRESNHLDNEAKKMEDTIYKYVITEGDTIRSKQIKD